MNYPHEIAGMEQPIARYNPAEDAMRAVANLAETTNRRLPLEVEQAHRIGNLEADLHHTTQKVHELLPLEDKLEEANAKLDYARNRGDDYMKRWYEASAEITRLRAIYEPADKADDTEEVPF